MSYGGFGVLVNSLDLEANAPGFKITGLDVHSVPTPALEQYVLARRNGKKFVAANSPERKITVEGVLSGNDKADAEGKLDVLKNLLRGYDQNIDLPYANSQRRWIGTVSNMILPKFIGSFMPISVEFDCSQPVGQDLTTTSQTIAAITTAASTQAITIGGSFFAYPLITSTLVSGTGLTAQSVTISNPANGMAITITRTWTAGDVIVIDCFNQTVTVNGVAVDSTGSWPQWDTGAGNFKWADTFTTRNVTTTFVYNKQWL